MDRHAAVVVALPSPGELERAPSGYHCTSRHGLAKNLPVDPGGLSVVEPVEQPPTVAAKLLTRSVVRAGDIPID